jgi:hypothetical protein
MLATEAYSSIPVNRGVRRRLMRAARLGTRPVKTVPNIGDAARAVDAVAAVWTGWSSSTDPFPAAVKQAWSVREERP